jgi:predicted DNA-binding transcriptional regulator AlpA
MPDTTVRPMPERLWSIHDTADFLGIPVQTLYWWRTEGRGPRAYRVGRHLRYDPARIQEWLEAEQG